MAWRARAAATASCRAAPSSVSGARGGRRIERRPPPGSVLVPVSRVREVAVAFVDVVGVALVLDRLVAAAVAVLVLVGAVLGVGQRALVPVALVLGVGVALGDVVGVALVL